MILVIALEYGARTIHAKRKIRDWKWKLCPRINVLAEHRAFIVIHPACQCDMTFAVFLPEESRQRPVPVLWYLSG